MKFPYRFFQGSHYPIIPVTVVSGDRKVNTSAVIDSGASISIFHGSFCKLLGLDAESGEKRIFQGASAKLIGYTHEVNIIIADKEIRCKVAFSNDLITSFNLLGRESVFDKFLITFNEKGRELSVENI